MAALDTLLRSISEDLIAQLGTTATLHTSTRSFSVATGQVTVSDVNTTVQCTPPFPYEKERIDGTIVQSGDAETLIAAKTLATAPVAEKDELTFAGIRWKVIAVNPVYSGDEVAVYVLQLRS